MTDTWAYLYGEWDRQPRMPHRTSRWCDNCQAWVERDDLKKWTGDGMLHGLCPGCDADLIDPQVILDSEEVLDETAQKHLDARGEQMYGQDRAPADISQAEIESLQDQEGDPL